MSQMNTLSAGTQRKIQIIQLKSKLSETDQTLAYFKGRREAIVRALTVLEAELQEVESSVPVAAQG